jgi:hypothetical protein
MTSQRWIRLPLLALACLVAACASTPRFDRALEACTAQLTPSEPIYVEMVNPGDEPIDLYWVRPVTGELVRYPVLAPRATLQQRTQVGHLWVAMQGRRALGEPVCVMPDTVRIRFAERTAY